MRFSARLSLVAMFSALLGCGAGESRPEVTAETRAAYGDLLIGHGECRSPGPARLSRERMSADVDVLERVLYRGYAGFEIAGGAEKWRETFVAVRAGLPTAPTSPTYFRNYLVAHLSFANDNHLGLITLSADGERSWRSTSGHRQAFFADLALAPERGVFVDETGAALIGCGGLSPEDLVRLVPGDPLPAVGHALVFLSDAPLSEVACTFTDALGGHAERTVALTRVDIGDEARPVYERREADFPWLRVRSLMMSHRGALDRFVETGPEVRDAPVVVLDVRGMPGGSDRFLLRWFKELTSEDLPYFRTRTLESEATLQGALNFWGCINQNSAQNGARADVGGRTWVSSRVDQAHRELETAMIERGRFREIVIEHDIIEGRAPSPFGGRLLLIVDRGCASACETAVLLSRHLVGTLVVGENTEGTMKVGELRSYRLPQSSIYVTAGHRVHEDLSEPDIFPEGIGYQPDLWLLGDDADSQIRRLADCLSDSGCAAGLSSGLRATRTRTAR